MKPRHPIAGLDARRCHLADARSIFAVRVVIVTAAALGGICFVTWFASASIP